MRFRAVVLSCVCVLPSLGSTVSKLVVTHKIDENSCSAPKPAASFDASDREAFAWFRAQHIAAGEALKVEWISPDGATALDADYQDLPASPSLCFASRLPIAGFAAASQPGAWKVRVLAAGRTLSETQFRITGQPPSGLQVTSVRRTSTSDGFDLTIDGSGFGPELIVHIAQYSAAGGWRYVSFAQPSTATPNQLTAHHGPLPAAEYLVIVKNGVGEVSRPVPFVIPTGGYKLPIVAGERWIVTQGPYGSVSHWGNTLHGYDIAPLGGKCVVAMKAGVAHVHDRGMRQDQKTRTFGNYITIDHGDGEYSHYAHLASGTFVVSEGQSVEQGQALAVVGNSGYTLGEGGGYHIHVQVSRSLPIASQSIPFTFEDLQAPPRNGTTVVSMNSSRKCDCGVRSQYPVMLTAASPASSKPSAESTGPKFSGHLGFSEWWTELVSVSARTPVFEVTLTWPRPDAGADLHLMSPSGHHYAWYADPTGYSGSESGPQQFRIPDPEPGPWRISVQAVRATAGEAVDFAVTTSGLKPPANHARSALKR